MAVISLILAICSKKKKKRVLLVCNTVAIEEQFLDLSVTAALKSGGQGSEV